MVPSLFKKVNQENLPNWKIVVISERNDNSAKNWQTKRKKSAYYIQETANAQKNYKDGST